MDIGNKLKELRVLKGLTQEELADRSELSKGFISQLERNLTSPSITTLMDILQCLGTSIGEFFNEAPDEQIVIRKTGLFCQGRHRIQKRDQMDHSQCPEKYHRAHLPDLTGRWLYLSGHTS